MCKNSLIFGRNAPTPAESRVRPSRFSTAFEPRGPRSVRQVPHVRALPPGWQSPPCARRGSRTRSFARENDGGPSGDPLIARARSVTAWVRLNVATPGAFGQASASGPGRLTGLEPRAETRLGTGRAARLACRTVRVLSETTGAGRAGCRHLAHRPTLGRSHFAGDGEHVVGRQADAVLPNGPAGQRLMGGGALVQPCKQGCGGVVRRLRCGLPSEGAPSARAPRPDSTAARARRPATTFGATAMNRSGGRPHARTDRSLPISVSIVSRLTLPGASLIFPSTGGASALRAATVGSGAVLVGAAGHLSRHPLHALRGQPTRGSGRSATPRPSAGQPECFHREPTALSGLSADDAVRSGDAPRWCKAA